MTRIEIPLRVYRKIVDEIPSKSENSDWEILRENGTLIFSDEEMDATDNSDILEVLTVDLEGKETLHGAVRKQDVIDILLKNCVVEVKK